MQQRAKITSKGQITVPRRIREALGVREGDTLTFDSTDGEVRVRAHRSAEAAGFIGACRVGSGKTVAQIVAEVRDIRD